MQRQSEQVGPKIYGFYHIAAVNNYRSILEEQLNRMRTSGLLKVTSKLHITLIGLTELPVSLPTGCEVIIRTAANVKLYERVCLNWMREVAGNTSEAASVWYVHTKGVSHHNTAEYPSMENWRRLMESFVLDRWKSCQSAIQQGADVVGILFRSVPWRHFSGNFWWSHLGHIRRLRSFAVTEDHLATAAQGNLKTAYYETEQWVCSYPCIAYSPLDVDYFGVRDRWVGALPLDLDIIPKTSFKLPPPNQMNRATFLIIHRATYGIPLHWLDITDRVRQLVQNNRLCIEKDTNLRALWPDASPGTCKYLRIYYTQKTDGFIVEQCCVFREANCHLLNQLVLQ